MGIGKQIHRLILLLLLVVAVSSSVVLAVASPVPYGGRVTNWTSPSTLAVTAAEVGLAATAEEFLMESETSQMVLNSFFGTTRKSGTSGKPVVTCGVVGYKACLPDPNGRKPKRCSEYTRECVY